MKLVKSAVPLLALGLALSGSAQTTAQSNGKVAVINVQAAVIGTKDGQKAANELTKRFGPRKDEFDKRNADIAQLQQQLGKATADDERARLTRDIDQKTKALNRDREDVQAELDQERRKIMSDIGGRLVAVMNKYANDHGYTWVLDVSSQQTPVVYASETIDITKEVINLYDSSASTPATPAAKPAAPAAKPAVPAPKPATPSK